jgi:hypothetical protein
MSTWTPVPEPVTWPLPKPMEHGGVQYVTVTVGAPTVEDILKATAVRGAAGVDVTLRMIASASQENVPYDVLKKQPSWLMEKISEYFEEFAGAPAPDPLESWRAARRAALAAEAAAVLEAASPPPS